MFDQPRTMSDADLARLLSEAGRQLAYPPVPDFARAFETLSSPSHSESVSVDENVWQPPGRQSTSAPAPGAAFERQPRRRWRQAVRLGGAVAAFALVGLMLVLVFRGVGDDEQATGSTLNTPTEPLLIAVGTEGTLTALDPHSGEVHYTINGDNQPDAIFSPDGTRLFVAGLSLSAHDARTGDEIWRVPYQFRVGTISNVGPSTLAISPDGSRLYVYSYDMNRSTGPTADSVPFFIQTFDTATGELLGESEPYASGAICAPRLHPSPDGTKLYAPCERGTGYRVYELPMGKLAPAQLVTGFPRLIATASHGDRLFLITHSGEFTTQSENLTVIDMREGAIIDQRVLDLGGYAVQGQSVMLKDGSRLYVGVSDTVDDFAADAVLAFDTQTWQQVGRFEPELPITTRELTVDADGMVYTASTEYGDNSSSTSSSTIWRIDPEAGTVEVVAEFPGQEIAHVLIGNVPVDQTQDAASSATVVAPPTSAAQDSATPAVVVEATPSPTSTATAAATETPSPTVALPPTPTIDMSAAAIEAALAALPADEAGCQATPGNAGDVGWEVAGVTLIGEGELWLNILGGEDYVLPPIQAGRTILTYWNIAGPNADSQSYVTLTATELGTGTSIEPDGRQPPGTGSFREGTIWRGFYTFPHAGCWQVVAERAGYAGVLWLTVEDAP